MTFDIVLCGVGGQGSLSVAVLITRTAMAAGFQVKQSEVHGMAQRGGEVLAHLRISDAQIESPTIPKGSADMLLAFEPLEALRYLPWLKKDKGVLIAASSPVRNIRNYPELDAIVAEIKKIPGAHIVDAEAIAKAAGNPRAANVALVGAAASFLPLSPEALEKEIAAFFAPRGEEIAALNIKAFRDGRAL